MILDNINKHKPYIFYLISNTCTKKHFINNLYKNSTINLLNHQVQIDYAHKSIKQYLIERNMTKFTEKDKNKMYITISRFDIVHGKIINVNNISESELLYMITGKRYKIYHLVSVYYQGKYSHKLSKEVYVNIYYKNIDNLLLNYEPIVIKNHIMPRIYKNEGSITRSIWCLTNHLLK